MGNSYDKLLEDLILIRDQAMCHSFFQQEIMSSMAAFTARLNTFRFEELISQGAPERPEAGMSQKINLLFSQMKDICILKSPIPLAYTTFVKRFHDSYWAISKARTHHISPSFGNENQSLQQFFPSLLSPSPGYSPNSSSTSTNSINNDLSIFLTSPTPTLSIDTLLGNTEFRSMDSSSCRDKCWDDLYLLDQPDHPTILEPLPSPSISPKCKEKKDRAKKGSSATKKVGAAKKTKKKASPKEGGVGSRPPFSSIQKAKLKEVFVHTKYPLLCEKEELMAELGLTRKQVDFWFANTRHRS